MIEFIFHQQLIILELKFEFRFHLHELIANAERLSGTSHL